MLQVQEEALEFHENDECPFCDGHLHKAGEELYCTNNDCLFNDIA